MRAICELLAVAGVVAILGLGERPELLGGGVLLLVVIAVVLRRADQVRIEVNKTATTLEVRTLVAPLDLEQDLEGKTVPAPITPEAAYEMHQRYAPAFDQQLALAKHLERHGDERYAPAPNEPSFDPERYARGRTYADAFDRQLERRRTRRYEVVQPRLARGSVPEPGMNPYAEQLAPEPAGWDPHRPPSVTAMRRLKDK